MDANKYASVAAYLMVRQTYNLKTVVQFVCGRVDQDPWQESTAKMVTTPIGNPKKENLTTWLFSYHPS
jgi:hypothetical protein